MKLSFLSENTIVILFKQEINRTVFQQVCQYTEIINRQLSEYIIDIIPSYTSIHIAFDLLKITSDDFSAALVNIDKSVVAEKSKTLDSKLIEIPVYYGEEVGLDQGALAKFANIGIDEVIAMHSLAIYDVYAIGFSPGFAYLGSVDKRIAMPRKEAPRKKVCKGSVAIADQQTAVYPEDSPGGWQIIGRTAISLIDYSDAALTKFTVGDKVKFIPISKADYIDMGGAL